MNADGSLSDAVTFDWYDLVWLALKGVYWLIWLLMVITIFLVAHLLIKPGIWLVNKTRRA